MPSLVVIRPQIKEKQKGAPPSLYVPKDPSLKRVKEPIVLSSLTLGNNYNINARSIDAIYKMFQESVAFFSRSRQGNNYKNS